MSHNAMCCDVTAPDTRASSYASASVYSTHFLVFAVGGKKESLLPETSLRCLTSGQILSAHSLRITTCSSLDCLPDLVPDQNPGPEKTFHV